MSSPTDKPSDARHLKQATRHNDLTPSVLKTLYNKAMDPKYITKVDGYDCVLSTRTGSQDMPQLKLEMKEGKKIQILCTHAVALHDGKKAQHWFDDLSHLCGIRQCLVHTCWELPWDNVSRDGCHKYKYFANCPHQPPCLPEPPYNLVKAAIQLKQKAEEAAVVTDVKKAKKRIQNADAYKRKKKQKLNLDKQMTLARQYDSDEEKENDENRDPNTGTSSKCSSIDHIIID